MKGYIYFIENESGHIKIGFSVNPEARLKSLQTANAEPLTMLAVIPGTMDDERALHLRFADNRIGGEWFDQSCYYLRRVMFAADYLYAFLPSWRNIEPVKIERSKPELAPSQIAMGENLDLMNQFFDIVGSSEKTRSKIIFGLANNPNGIDPAGDVMRYGIEASMTNMVCKTSYILACCTRGMEQGNVRV